MSEIKLSNEDIKRIAAEVVKILTPPAPYPSWYKEPLPPTPTPQFPGWWQWPNTQWPNTQSPNTQSPFTIT